MDARGSATTSTIPPGRHEAHHRDQAPLQRPWRDYCRAVDRDGRYGGAGVREPVGEHHPGPVAVQAVPAPALVVGRAALAPGTLVEPLDDPAAGRRRDAP